MDTKAIDSWLSTLTAQEQDDLTVYDNAYDEAYDFEGSPSEIATYIQNEMLRTAHLNAEFL